MNELIQKQREGEDIRPANIREEYQIRSKHGRLVASFGSKELLQNWMNDKPRAESLRFFRVETIEEEINVQT